MTIMKQFCKSNGAGTYNAGTYNAGTRTHTVPAPRLQMKQKRFGQPCTILLLQGMMIMMMIVMIMIIVRMIVMMIMMMLGNPG